MESKAQTLHVEQLSCVRGSRTLFRDLSFSLSAGKLLYLQGENGSGKTTLLRTLCGLSVPASGKVFWNNVEIKTLAETYYQQTLYIGHLTGMKDELTPIENLQFAVSLYGLSITDAVCFKALQQLNIERCADLPTSVLSQGQKRRVALAQLWLLDQPMQTPLWILDEPFTALDTNAIALLTLQIEKFIENGGLLTLTSHQVPSFNPNIMQHLHLS